MSRPIDITRTQEKTYTNLLNKYKKALRDEFLKLKLHERIVCLLQDGQYLSGDKAQIIQMLMALLNEEKDPKDTPQVMIVISQVVSSDDTDYLELISEYLLK
jgi:ABC-type uncharacterized transport system ATPase component